MESLLDDYFNSENALQNGLPTVQYLSQKLALSPGCLSDMLRNLTGLNTQQHIHQKLIEKANEYLTGSQLSIAEISYQLGFEHPQSFSKLFKKKTNLSPVEYKQLWN
jgi:AraC-like DNA-binding protein